MRISLLALLCLALAGCGSTPSSPADSGTDARPTPTVDSGPSSGNDAGPTPTTDAGLGAFENEMLVAHNTVRASASPTPSPALAPLTWSASAASTAQAWANNCQWMHNTGSGFGENIFAASGTSSATDVVNSWASEVSSYDYAANACSGTCGHYTQLVWRDTTSVGCAFANCTTNSPFGSGDWFFVVCDYDPPGNFVGQRPY